MVNIMIVNSGNIILFFFKKCTDEKYCFHKDTFQEIENERKIFISMESTVCSKFYIYLSDICISRFLIST